MELTECYCPKSGSRFPLWETAPFTMPYFDNWLKIVKFAVALLMLCMHSFAAAEAIDRIDVTAGEREAEIAIRFNTRILYERHAPVREGKLLRVFLTIEDRNVRESELMQQVMQSPKTSRVPTVSVVYPELIHGMLLTFSQSTSYTVRPGEDGQSIIVSVPLLPPDKKNLRPGGNARRDEVAANSSKRVAEIALPAISKGADPEQAAPPSKKPLIGTPSDASQPRVPVASVPQNVPSGTAVLSAAVPPAMPPVEVEPLALRFMNEAIGALTAKDVTTAINRLNRVLSLPRNDQTERAQGLIGEARELNGEVLKARAEYDLYLKLFPEGSEATKIRERLSALPKDAPRSSAQRALPKEPGPAEWTYFGSLSEYYYTGKSQIETLTPPAPGQLTFNQDTLSSVDQRSLISSINLNARRRDGWSDTRIVVRDTNNKNYLNPARGYNRLYSAYAEHTDRSSGYNFRVGRQNPNGMGVLERFDGLQGGYLITPSWRVNAVYGDAVEFNSPFSKKFVGASVDLLPQAAAPGFSIYGIQQTLDGMLNRRAFGTEARYFDGKISAYGLVDYDVLYSGVNIALLQGNYLDQSGNNYFFVMDHRRAPSYGLTNALMGAPGLTLNDLVGAQGIDAVRKQVVGLSAMSDMLSMGVTHSLQEGWQVGVDYRMSQISSNQPISAVIPLAVIGTCLGTIDPVNNNCIFDTATQQGSGKNHVITFQGIGSNLFWTNAVGVANLSLIQAPSYSGKASSLSYVVPFAEQWRADVNFRYYKQDSDDGTTQRRLSPSVKLSWQWQNSLFLEGELGREISDSSSQDRKDHVAREYLYMGLRWDVR